MRIINYLIVSLVAITAAYCEEQVSVVLVQVPGTRALTELQLLGEVWPTVADRFARIGISVTVARYETYEVPHSIAHADDWSLTILQWCRSLALLRRDNLYYVCIFPPAHRGDLDVFSGRATTYCAKGPWRAAAVHIGQSPKYGLEIMSYVIAHELAHLLGATHLTSVGANLMQPALHFGGQLQFHRLTKESIRYCLGAGSRRQERLRRRIQFLRRHGRKREARKLKKTLMRNK